MLLTGVPAAWAGGTPENLLLIIDPSNRDSLYIGNYYKNARQIPDSNVIYIYPGAADFATLADRNLDTLFGSLTNACIDDHTDYIVVMPGAPFYVNAPNLITDGCAPVTRFAISSVYTMAFIADEILSASPKLPSSTANRFYNIGAARAFDSSFSYYGGSPNNSSAARRYFIGMMLGYTGQRGNTLADLVAMIDRSVAVDGTRPAGTFYFMNNAGDPARNVRASQFAGAVTAIQNAGGQAQIIDGILPAGHHDCLGIMTGAADPAVDTTDMTILPGAFCDHLTSYAATFDAASQVKLSRWIANGASGSWGATEEPCNYTGKFPQAKFHYLYFLGLSLGEAGLRSAAYTPFQMLLYGDPMARPFAYIPSVAVNDAPTGPVSGTIVLTPTATTNHPTGQIASFDLLIDGVLKGSTTPGGTFAVDTTLLADGWHDLRILAYDNTLVKSAGRWLGSLTVDNHGRSTALGASPATGDPATPFVFDIAAAGGTPSEVRVVQNGRVVAAAPGSSALLTVYGLTLGAGPVHVQAEALYGDGRVVRSTPAALDVSYDGGTPGGQPPVAFGYTKRVWSDSPFLVELPATFDDATVPLTFELLSTPPQAGVPSGQTGPYRLMRPAAGATGVDTFTFHVTSAAGNSNVAAVTLVYVLLGDLNCDGAVNAFDIDPFVLALTDAAGYVAAYPNCDLSLADINRDRAVNSFDIDPFVALLTGG